MDTITTTTNKNHRARWAAVGAAIAVSLGAGGIGISHAVVESPTPMPIYTAITPCRLIDTRAEPTFHIGPHTTLTNDQTITVAGWGDVEGDCNLSGASAALELNVTAVGPSQATVLTVFPAGETRPNASNLNPTPGQPPTPNSVTATLNATGEFSIWNAFGTVDVVVDVVGVYEDHQHTGEDIVDESLTGADIDNHSVSSLDTSNEAGLATAYVEGPERPTPGNILLIIGAELTPVADLQIRVPANGYLDIEVSGTFTPDNDAGLNGATCQLGLNQAGIDADEMTFQVNDFGAASETPVSFNSHRVVQVNADDNPSSLLTGQSVELLCIAHGGILPLPAGTNLDGEFTDITITATYMPTSYKAGIFILPPIVIPFP